MAPSELKTGPDGDDSRERDALRDRVLEELRKESDKGCILVGASLLSDFLEKILRAALTADPHAVKHAVAPLFEPMAPPATFSSKIKLAYGLGLLPKYCFGDLEKVRRIRNVAAHEHSEVSFENQEIVGITRTLEGADHAVRSLQLENYNAMPDTGRREAS